MSATSPSSTSVAPFATFTQSVNFAQRYEPYTANDRPEALVATALVAETDSTLAFVIRWKTNRARPKDLLNQLDRSLAGATPDRAMDRLKVRMAKFRWNALNRTVRLEVMGVEQASHHNFVVIDGEVKIKSRASDERLQITEPNQPFIFTLFFVAPTGKRIAASFFGGTTATPGEMTTYVKVVQEVLDSLRHFEPLRGALGSPAPNAIAVTDADSAKSSSADEHPQAPTEPRVDLQTRIKKLAVALNKSPWLLRRYVLELLAIWLGLFSVLFDPDWRILLPVPLALAVLALLGPVFIGRAERENLAGMSPRSVARVMSMVGAIGLVGTQISAILSVPIRDTARVSLWVFLSISQLRIISAIARRHLISLRESVKSYLLAINWVKPGGDAVRYEERIRTLRSQSSTSGAVSVEPIEAEAEPQISLLIRLYHGVIAAVLVVLTYFVIGERFAGQAVNSDGGATDFIFVNNEGFTAALALLIILISTVAVQMFTDLASQIRLQDERFENDVSKLAIGLGNYEVALSRVWGHFVEYLPDVSRAVNAALSEIWEALEKNDPEIVRQIVTGSRPPEKKYEISKTLVLASESSVVQAWLKDGWFENTAKLRDLSAARYLAWAISLRRALESGSYSRAPVINASMPSDEDQVMRAFNLNLVQDEEVRRQLQTVRDKIERLLLALTLKTSRYLAGTSNSDSYSIVIESCNALDIDASYFLDDRILFSEITSSARLFDSEGAKENSRGPEYHQDLRDAEIARVLLFAAWISQINSYASTPLHAVLNTRQPEPTADKVEYTTSVLSETIPNVFKHDALLSETEADELLTKPDKGTERFKWLMRVSLADPQSALHCLTRAALARNRRQRLAEFETNADRWRARRILSLPIVPRYQDRVNHLAAVLGISDQAQSGLRLRSVNDAVKLPTSTAQISAISTWALKEKYVDCDFSTALRFKETRRKWADFAARVGPNSGMRQLKFVLEDLAFKQHMAEISEVEITHASMQTIGNSAFDETRAWYQQNDFRWQSPRENERNDGVAKQFLNRFWRYHCLLSVAFGAKLIGKAEFRSNSGQHIREVIVTVDPSIGDLLEVKSIRGNRDSESVIVDSDSVIAKVTDFCLDDKNDRELLRSGFFIDLGELTTWRRQATQSGGQALATERIADSLGDSGEMSTENSDDVSEDFGDGDVDPEENSASTVVGDTTSNDDSGAGN